MKMHVTFEAYPSTFRKEDVTYLRSKATEFFKLQSADSRVKENGWFVGRRGGFLVMEVSDPAEVMQVVGPLIDNFDIKITATGPWSMVQEMFDRDIAEGRF